MTSAISLNNRRVLNFFTFTLKKQTPLTILVTAFALLFCPGTLLSQIMERIANYGLSSDKRPDMSCYFLGYTVGIFVVGVGLCLLLTVTNFSFLYSKKSGDVFHARPLTRAELLTVRMVSSFIGGFFTMSVMYASLSLINVMPGVISIPAATVISVYVAMVLMLIMLTVFTTLFALCSGGIFDFAIAILGVNIAIPLLYLIFENILEHNAYGVVYNLENGLKYTSPFVFATLVVIEIGEGVEDAFENYFSTFGSVNIFDTVLFIIFTVLCIFAVYKLFQIRRSESAGEAYSFPFMPHIISVLVSVVGGYALGYIFTGNGFTDFDFWIFFIIGTALCSVTAGAVFTRGFKTVRGSLIRGAVSLGLTVILVISLVFVAASHESYIPKAEQIEKITVGYNEEVEFTDKFDIVLDIHKAVLDTTRTKDHVYDQQYYCIADEFDSIRMKYYLKSGKVITRQYYTLVDSVYDPLFIRYAKSDEYVKRYLDFEGIDKLVELRYYDYEDNNKIDHSKQPLHAGISPEVTVKLATAYAEEFKNAPESAFYEACDVLSVHGMNSTSYGIEMRIPESFTKTREILSRITFTEDVEEDIKYKFED